MSELHPCEYCGTMLDENDEMDSNIPACGTRMHHYASQCREYVYMAKTSYVAEVGRLRAVLARIAVWDPSEGEDARHWARDAIM